MKKSLLFAVAAMSMVASANAQIISRVEQAKNAKMANVAKSQVFDLSNVCEKEAQVATSPSQLKKKAPATKAAWSGAYYGRPDGAFYINWDEGGGGYVRPFLYGKPFTAYTYPNLTEGNASYEWTYYQVEKVDGKYQEVPYTTDSKDLTVDYGYTAVTVPILNATFASGASSYQLGGNKQGQPVVPTSFFATQYPNEALLSNYEGYCDLLANAHYYGSSDRTATKQNGWGYYSGKNQDGTPGGHWFGKNTLGWDIFGGAFEKPTKPYVLNNVYFYATALEVTGDAPITATVYRLDHMFPYLEGENVVIGEAEVNEEAVVARGSIVLTKANTKDGRGVYKIPLKEIEDGLEYEVTPEIDFPILVVIDGLGGDNVKSASLLATEDEVDEGKGELAFLGNKESNVFRGLNNFFQSGEMKSGLSIFIGQTNPFLVFNYNGEDGKYKFPDNGGTLVREFGQQAMDYVSFYSSTSSEEWDLSCNGAEVPEWLNIELSDVMDNGEFSGEVRAKVTAAALPEGVAYREAKVKFHTLGDYQEFLFTQGEPSGINDVTATGNAKAHKVVENGQVLVVVGDKKYNMMGAEVK